MSVNIIKNMGHSVNVRLKNLSQTNQIAFDYLLLRYARNKVVDQLCQSYRLSLDVCDPFIILVLHGSDVRTGRNRCYRRLQLMPSIGDELFLTLDVLHIGSHGWF